MLQCVSYACAVEKLHGYTQMNLFYFFVRHLLHSNACTFSLRINDSEMLSCDMDI